MMIVRCFPANKNFLSAVFLGRYACRDIYLTKNSYEKADRI